MKPHRLKPHSAELVRMVAVQWHGRREIMTFEEAQNLRNALGKAVTVQTCNADTIELAVCDDFGLPPEQMATDRRDVETCDCRHVIFYFLSLLTDLGWSGIGARFPRKGQPRDMDTVRNGFRKVVTKMAADPVFAARITKINKALTKTLKKTK